MQLVAEIFSGFFNDAREWSRGRHWPLRLLLWLWLAWLAFHYTRDSAYSSIIGGLNLGVHEFAAVLRVLAIACLWSGVAWGAYLLWRMIRIDSTAERLPSTDY